MRCAWSSSGGKDSLLALWHARQQGLDVRTLLTMFDATGLRNRSHGIELPLMQAQARSLGMELLTPHASWREYETVFVEALQKLHATGHEAVVFGDIDLLPHREWEEKVCARAGLQAVLPLWQRNRRELAEESLRLGFKSIVVCVDHRHLTRDFAGRLYDESFLADLPENVDACGENGEFHTFVYDGPMFSESLNVEVSAIEDYQAPSEFGGGWFSFARLRERAKTPPP
jgi:uncharacterized protein (TIGR00290 family)